MRKTIVTLAVLVPVLGLVYGGLNIAGAAQPAASSNVTIDNTAANPVPVEEQSTVNVKVRNANGNPVPVQQQGPLTVTVSNPSLPVTGTLNIDPSSVQKTSAADNPALQPVEVVGGEGNIYSVPAGKELVIDQVSIIAIPVSPSVPAATGELLVRTPGSSLASFSEFFPLEVSGGIFMSGSQHTQFYASAGQNLFCGILTADQNLQDSAECNVAGHLVDIQ